MSASPELRESDLRNAHAPGHVPTSGNVWQTLLLGALLAAGIYLVLGEVLQSTYVGTPELVPTQAGPEMRVSRDEANRAITKNAALINGIGGAVFAGLLGYMGGRVSHCTRRGVIAALTGLFLGGAAGVAISLAVARGFFAFEFQAVDDFNSLLWQPLGILCPLGGAIGAVAGLCHGMGQGRRMLAALLGGLVGGILGTLLGGLLTSIVFPIGNAVYPIPDTLWARLLTRSLAFVAVAIGVALAMTAESRPAGKGALAAGHSAD